MTKEQDALNLIAEQLGRSRRPVVLCSFGKDSITLLHLVLRLRKVPVLHFRLPRFHEKDQHAWRVAMLWDLEVHDARPVEAVDYQHADFFEVLHLYQAGPKGILALASGIQPRKPEDTRFLCALNDLVLRPCAADQEYPWDLTFHGHKECDPIEFGREARFTSNVVPLGSTTMVLPLSNWTDDDIWEYIGKYDLPYDRRRYDENVADVNPDHYPTCFNCLDYRTIGQQVPCPLKGTMPNVARSKEQHEEFRLALIDRLAYADVTGSAIESPIDHMNRR